MIYGELQKDGSIVNVVNVDQSTLTSDCWLIQIKGLSACKSCEFFNTNECGGQEILQKIYKQRKTLEPT